MTIAVSSTLQTLAQTYTDLGLYFGLATTNPGSTAAPNNYEASGPVYARVKASWVNSSPGLFTSPGLLIKANDGTYTYAILCQGPNAGTADMIDNCQIAIPPLAGTGSGGGQIVLSASYQQS